MKFRSYFLILSGILFIIYSCSKDFESNNNEVYIPTSSAIGSNNYNCGENFSVTFEFVQNGDTLSSENYGIMHNDIIDWVVNQDTTGYNIGSTEGAIDFLDYYITYYIENVSSDPNIELYFSTEELYDSLNWFLITTMETIDDTASNVMLTQKELVFDYLDTIRINFPILMDQSTQNIVEDIFDDIYDDGDLDDFDYQSIIDSTYDGSYKQILLANFYSIAQYSTCYAKSLEQYEKSGGVFAAIALADATGAYISIMRALIGAGIEVFRTGEAISDQELSQLVNQAAAQGAAWASARRLGQYIALGF